MQLSPLYAPFLERFEALDLEGLASRETLGIVGLNSLLERVMPKLSASSIGLAWILDDRLPLAGGRYYGYQVIDWEIYRRDQNVQKLVIMPVAHRAEIAKRALSLKPDVPCLGFDQWLEELEALQGVRG